MIYTFVPVVEMVEDNMIANILEEEVSLRRKLLVSGLSAYRSADMAWRVPGLITIRSGDSPADQRYDGVWIVRLREWGPVIQWTRRDHDEDFVQQEFDEEDGRRRPPYYHYLAAREQGARPTRVAWVGFPPEIPSAPWDRPGLWEVRRQ